MTFFVFRHVQIYFVVQSDLTSCSPHSTCEIELIKEECQYRSKVNHSLPSPGKKVETAWHASCFLFVRTGVEEECDARGSRLGYRVCPVRDRYLSIVIITFYKRILIVIVHFPIAGIDSDSRPSRYNHSSWQAHWINDSVSVPFTDIMLAIA
jgi:hypothetical protein